MPSIMLQNKFEITDEDIKRAEKIFFPNGGTFSDPNNERINFIKCLDKNLHVQACPGSGKTTTLLAKLYLLSEKMPFENNRGICVLTHTNVAIDIIKRKLGDKASKLLNYPNFFGTIQSFVDKYLAIPYYTKIFNYKPLFIDTEVQKDRILKTYFLEGFSEEILQKTRHFLIANDIAGKYTVCKTDAEHILIYSNTKKNINIKKPRSKKDWDESEKSKIKEALIKLKLKVLKQDRVLSFDDAYDFAKLYIMKYPNLKRIFSSRFKYVFIDEAQDTSAIQKEIIESLFDENVIIQWIGDTNQTIMNENYSESAWKPEKDGKYDVLEITDSKRISQPIADIIKTVTVKSYSTLNGIQEINLRPVIILFNDNNIFKVLPKFAELLIETKASYDGEEKSIWEISKLTGNPVKAVGWVGQEKNNGLSISSYFENFNKIATIKRKQYFPNLYTMYELSKNSNPKEFKDRVINCILESLNISEIKYKDKKFTKTSFYDFVFSKDENLLIELNTQIVNFYCGHQIFDDFSMHIISFLEEKLNSQLNEPSKIYLSEKELKEVKQEQAKSSNIFTHKINGTDVSFEIATVHSVKGETHTATLYLDTKFYKNSIEYILEQLKGNVYQKQDNNDRKEKALRISHVAFSRPTHLLCIAINQNSIKADDMALSTDKFEIMKFEE